MQYLVCLCSTFLMAAAAVSPERFSAQQTIAAPPAITPDPSVNHPLTDALTAPQLILSVEPEFSERLRRRIPVGHCVAAVTVDIDGTAKDAWVISSTPDASDRKLSFAVRDAVAEMRTSCIKTVQQYRFRPAICHGKPVPFEMKVEIQFLIF